MKRICLTLLTICTTLIIVSCDGGFGPSQSRYSDNDYEAEYHEIDPATAALFEMEELQEDIEDLQYEVDKLKSEVDRFSYDDWADVVPDVESATRYVDNELDNVIDSADTLEETLEQ